MSTPSVKAALSDLFEARGLGQEFRVSKLAEHVNSPDPVISLRSLETSFRLSGDEQEAKRQTPESQSFVEIDKYTLFKYRNRRLERRENKQGWERCQLCNDTVVTGTEEFCEECKNHCPDIIEKVERYWNGDKCAICRDEGVGISAKLAKRKSQAVAMLEKLNIHRKRVN